MTKHIPPNCERQGLSGKICKKSTDFIKFNRQDRQERQSETARQPNRKGAKDAENQGEPPRHQDTKNLWGEQEQPNRQATAGSPDPIGERQERQSETARQPNRKGLPRSHRGRQGRKES
jgi:hypothetical protein